ncbi:MAG: FAD-binding oxidoreductase, partial [Chloroflexi bacterium]|nr:FAD-binding oxidoreductase [Chloroflexota bacterium]
MASLTESQQGWLRERFGGRVRFDPIERKIYSHDVGEVPGLIKPLLGRALADAVVQPKDEAELAELARWAAREGVPLVPRAKGTSGYGGVIPVKGGVTLDTRRFQGVVAVDRHTLTATVRAATVWADLESALAKEGLALRVYPSSAPSSTVAGWLAQGGVGYGCYQHGPFLQSVVSARLVLPNGEVRDMAGDELLMVSEALGTTGVISEVTVRVRPLEAEALWAFRFSSAQALAAALRAVDQAGLPLWSVSFINPHMARLKNQLPPRLVHGHPVEEHRPTLPEAYIAVFVAGEGRQAEVEAALPVLASEAGGVLLDEEIAHHEWEERFNLLHVKRLGPSLVPAEVVVPLSGLAATLEGVDSAVRLPFVMEGMVSAGAAERQVTLL